MRRASSRQKEYGHIAKGEEISFRSSRLQAWHRVRSLQILLVQPAFGGRGRVGERVLSGSSAPVVSSTSSNTFRTETDAAETAVFFSRSRGSRRRP